MSSYHCTLFQASLTWFQFQNIHKIISLQILFNYNNYKANIQLNDYITLFSFYKNESLIHSNNLVWLQQMPDKTPCLWRGLSSCKPVMSMCLHCSIGVVELYHCTLEILRCELHLKLGHRSNLSTQYNSKSFNQPEP